MKIKLTYKLSRREIESITQCIVCTAKSEYLDSIATHSSEVTEGTLFLALQGTRGHGEDFRDEVLARGGCLLTDRPGENSFTVSSVIDALFALASAHLARLSSRRYTIAITGSVGKTTTKEMLRRMLSGRYRTHATEGNQNSEIGLPLTILSAPIDTELLILEMGMNHRGEIARLSRLTKPDRILITNIGHAHIGNLGSRTAIAEAKKEILLGAAEDAKILIPANEPLLADIPNAEKIGLFSEVGDHALIPSKGAEGGHTLLVQGKEILQIPHSIHDKGLLAAMAFATVTALNLGTPPHFIFDIISKFDTNIFRQNRFVRNKKEIVFDAYNASPESVLCAIDSLRREPRRAHALVLGDMMELGDQANNLHRAIGGACAAARDSIDLLFLFGAHAPLVAEGAIAEGFCKNRIFINTDETRPDVTAEAILKNASTEACIWIKGARSMRMERILKILTSNESDNDHAG